MNIHVATVHVSNVAVSARATLAVEGVGAAAGRGPIV